MTIRFTLADCPEGHVVTVSPVRMVPDYDLSRVATEHVVGAHHHLHRESGTATRVGIALQAHGLEILQQRRPVEVRRAVALRDHVVAEQRAHRDGVHRGAAEHVVEVVHDLLEDVLIVVHQVHLVDRDHDVRDPEQRRDVGVTPRLLRGHRSGVHQDDGQVGRRRAGRHVARVLLVPGRVGDDEFAPGGGEVAVAPRRS